MLSILEKRFPRAVRHRSQRGLMGGIAELVMVVSAALLVVGGIIGIAYAATSTSNAVAEWNNDNAVINNVRALYQGEPYPAASMNAALITQKQIGNLRNATPTIYNQYGGAIVVTGATTNFTFSTAGIPQNDCVAILKKIPATGFVSVTVDAAAFTLPATIATAQAACTAGTHTIVFTVQ